MTAGNIESLDGSLSDDAEPGPLLELVQATTPSRSFDEAMVYYRDTVAAYRPNNDKWRTDYHAEGADWVYDHLDMLRKPLVTHAELVIPPEAA